MDPDVGEWRPHTVGGELIHNQVTLTAFKLKICYAAYLAFQFDDMTIHYTCQWPMVEERLLTKGYESYVGMMRRFVFSEMISLVDIQNQGTSAGRFGTVNLGDASHPLRITPTNAPALIGSLQQILNEWTYWIDNQMFLIVPIEFRQIIQLSKLADASYSGMSESMLVDGKWPRQLSGFDVYDTAHLPRFVMPGGEVCWYFIAGSREAYAYASDIIMARVVRGENTITTKYQMVAAWGGAMLYPRKLVVACGYLDNEISFS